MMNLHRSGTKPEWESVKIEDRNFWQNLAASTSGVLTLPNIVTMIGFGLVIAGCVYLIKEDYWPALILLAVGRAADILDGVLAEATGTKSPLGEILDATIDKIGTFLSFIAMLYVPIAPRWMLLLLIVPQIINTVVILYYRNQNKKWHPSQVGKLSMAALWVSATGLMILAALENPSSSITNTIYAITVSSGLLGFYVSADYFKKITK